MPDAGYLTIGKVVKRLQGQYPDLSISKVRYLEDEGLLNPSRTPSGYRLYSQKDVHRLETILYLQKNRFMPLSVIKQQLDGGEGHADLAQTPYPNVGEDDEEVRQKFHPIDRMPELLGVPVSFVRQLSEAGVIRLRESPHGQYVTAANRESAMFEQALVVFAKKGGGVEMERTEENRQQFGQALSEMLALTGQVRDTLIRRQISKTFSEMEE